MKKLIVVFLVALFIGAIVSSCGSKAPCPAYSKTNSVENTKRV